MYVPLGFRGFWALVYFKGPIWSTEVHKVLQSEKKQDRRYSDPKACNG